MRSRCCAGKAPASSRADNASAFGYHEAGIMRLSPLLTLLFALCLSLAAPAQVEAPASARPNFSGFWKLDRDKSDFGQLEGPVTAAYVIRHVGSKLEFDYTQDGRTSRVEITPDGDERVTESVGDSETLTRAYWSGSVLVIEARQRRRSSLPGVKWTSRWNLSEDRKVLTIQRRISTPAGDADQTVVFHREAKESKHPG